MAAANTTPESIKQIHYLAAALKAPRITEAAQRLADQARDAGWTHEDYLAAVLDREVSARNASGAELRIRAAGFPARKTLEDGGEVVLERPARVPGLVSQPRGSFGDAGCFERSGEMDDLLDRLGRLRGAHQFSSSLVSPNARS